MPRVTVSVQACPRDLRSWLELARRAEANGFSALLAPDHPGSAPSPWPALGAAAAVTTSLRLGTYVVQTGVREPAHVATDAATLDILAPGRVALGLGAGHTPAEWEAIGRTRPSPGERAGRLMEFVEAVAALLDRQAVTRTGGHLSLHEARLLVGSPAERRIELAVGGGGRGVLRVAAQLADVVALSGLGRTLADGHEHEVRWSRAELTAQLQIVQDDSRAAGTAPAIESLVQQVEVTGDRAGAVERITAEFEGAVAEDIDQTPFMMIGTHAELAAQLRRQAGEFGITRYVVREAAMTDVEPVLALLADDPA
jgi:probable F420-dependent oxidoreductase